MEKEYTSLAIRREDKDLFEQINLTWNMRNKENRLTKEEFFRLLVKKFIENTTL